MDRILSYFRGTRGNEFSINYPYYGLFASAEVKQLEEKGEKLYECRLVNGSVVQLKKLPSNRKWVEAASNTETPLAAIMGASIDDYLKQNGN